MVISTEISKTLTFFVAGCWFKAYFSKFILYMGKYEISSLKIDKVMIFCNQLLKNELANDVSV